jgi:hypothetical protein
VKPRLQELYRTRAAAYQEALNSFVEGYKEGYAGLPGSGDGDRAQPGPANADSANSASDVKGHSSVRAREQPGEAHQAGYAANNRDSSESTSASLTPAGCDGLEQPSSGAQEMDGSAAKEKGPASRKPQTMEDH